MATELNVTLQRIMSKCYVLLEKQNAQEAEISQLREQVQQLDTQVKNLQAERETLLMELKYLKMANNIAPSPQDAKKASQAISKLVRDIDKCISQLSE